MHFVLFSFEIALDFNDVGRLRKYMGCTLNLGCEFKFIVWEWDAEFGNRKSLGAILWLGNTNYKRLDRTFVV